MQSNDITDYVQECIDNIYIILMGYKDYINCVDVGKTDDIFIPKYPYITIEFDSMQQEWKEMPNRMLLIMNFSLTYYYANLSDANCRQGLREGLSKIASVFRENWSINSYCSELGSAVANIVPYVLAKGTDVVAGGVVSLQCKKIINIEFSD